MNRVGGIVVKALLADADGTLVDTVYLVRRGLYEAVRGHVLEAGVPAREVPDYEVFRRQLDGVIGGTALETIERVMQAMFAASPHHLAGLSAAAAHAMLEQIQDELAPEYCKPYPGLMPVLRGLASRGVRLGIVTSGRARHVARNFGYALPELGCRELHLDASLDAAGLTRRLEAALSRELNAPVVIVTAESVTRAKPDPAGMRLAAKRLEVRPAQCVMLGDHTVDMQAAVRAEVPVRIGVTHGFDDEPTLRAAGATTIIHSLYTLPGVI